MPFSPSFPLYLSLLLLLQVPAPVLFHNLGLIYVYLSFCMAWSIPFPVPFLPTVSLISPIIFPSLSLYVSLSLLCSFSVPFSLPVKDRIGWSTFPTGCFDLRRDLGPYGRWNTQMNLGSRWLVVMFDFGRNSSSWSVEQSASKLLRTSRGGGGWVE